MEHNITHNMTNVIRMSNYDTMNTYLNSLGTFPLNQTPPPHCIKGLTHLVNQYCAS